MLFYSERQNWSLTRTVKKNQIILYSYRGNWGREFRGTLSPEDIYYTPMKLKEYIAILQTFNPEVEVLKKIKENHGKQLLVELKKYDIIAPHVHFKYDPKVGHETLIDSFVV